MGSNLLVFYVFDASSVRYFGNHYHDYKYFIWHFFDKYMGQTPIEISDEERSINQYTYKNLRHQDISSVYNLAEKFKEKWMRGRVDLLRKANEFEQKQQLVMSANKQIRFFLPLVHWVLPQC